MYFFYLYRKAVQEVIVYVEDVREVTSLTFQSVRAQNVIQKNVQQTVTIVTGIVDVNARSTQNVLKDRFLTLKLVSVSVLSLPTANYQEF